MTSQFRSIGFRQFMDRVLMHGLEWMGLYYGSYRAVVVDRRPDDNQYSGERFRNLEMVP